MLFEGDKSNLTSVTIHSVGSYQIGLSLYKDNHDNGSTPLFLRGLDRRFFPLKVYLKILVLIARQ